MLVHDEYFVAAGPSEVLAAVSRPSLAPGFKLEERRPDRVFWRERGWPGALQRRRVVVSIEAHGTGTKLGFSAWASGSALRRSGGSLDLASGAAFLAAALPFGLDSLEGVPEPDPRATRAGPEGRREPRWVRWTRAGEYALIATGGAALLAFAGLLAGELPPVYPLTALLVAVIVLMLSALGLDLAARRALEVVSIRWVFPQIWPLAVFLVLVAVVLAWLLTR